MEKGGKRNGGSEDRRRREVGREGGRERERGNKTEEQGRYQSHPPSLLT